MAHSITRVIKITHRITQGDNISHPSGRISYLVADLLDIGEGANAEPRVYGNIDYTY